MTSTDTQPSTTGLDTTTTQTTNTKSLGITEPGTVDISRYLLPDASGITGESFSMIGEVSLAGNNSITGLKIPNNCRALNADGTPLTSIDIRPANIPAPAGFNVISAVEFGPGGATFDKPVTITYQYDTSVLPKGFKAQNLVFKYYDTSTSEWYPCDFNVDAQNNSITARISHFSSYAILYPVIAAGLGPSLIAVILGLYVLLGGVAIYLLISRRRSQVPVLQSPAAVSSPNLSYGAQPESRFNETVRSADGLREHSSVREDRRPTILWDEIIAGSRREDGCFKTTIEVQGGKIIIPRDGKSADIELINNPETRIMISMEYDPVLHPQGTAKVIILGSAIEYDKTKEIRK